MILLFTSNTKGGIVQFSLQVLHSCIELGFDVKLMVPNEVLEIIPVSQQPFCIGYSKPGTLLKSAFKNICEVFARENPKIIWFLDEGVVSKYSILRNKQKAAVIITVHDIVQHPSRMNLRKIAVEILKNGLRRKVFSKVNRVLLFSDYSHRKFKARYTSFDNKVIKSTLGAHVPIAISTKPKELDLKNKNRFILFFGRIDKYKGLEILLKAYNSSELKGNPDLVIAGSGKLTMRESILAGNPGILLLNRYIDDGEMIYLMENCEAVVLPYKEVTQSGVLPMAYHFGNPVIISCLPGLKENVVEGKTGHIFSKIDELVAILNNYAITNYKFEMRNDIKEYYNREMNWERNIKAIYEEFSKYDV